MTLLALMREEDSNIMVKLLANNMNYTGGLAASWISLMTRRKRVTLGTHPCGIHFPREIAVLYPTGP